MLEVPLDSHVFHLNVTLPKRFSKDEFVSRYVDTDLAAILEFIKDTNAVVTRLFIQTRYQENAPYELKEVLSVSVSLDSTGQTVFVCSGDEHETLVAKSRVNGPLSAAKRVWPRHSHTRWLELKTVERLAAASPRMPVSMKGRSQVPEAFEAPMNLPTLDVLDQLVGNYSSIKR